MSARGTTPLKLVEIQLHLCRISILRRIRSPDNGDKSGLCYTLSNGSMLPGFTRQLGGPFDVIVRTVSQLHRSLCRQSDVYFSSSKPMISILWHKYKTRRSRRQPTGLERDEQEWINPGEVKAYRESGFWAQNRLNVLRVPHP